MCVRALPGEVDVFYHGQTGTICSEGFTNADATVVCRSVGARVSGAVVMREARLCVRPPVILSCVCESMYADLSFSVCLCESV